jgi:uncharacterized protein YbjT (DUF2867 family)
MMDGRRKIAVAGATGRVGRHVVDALEEAGHEVVPMSRASGVDVVTREGLDAALEGVEAIVDAATQPSPDELAATEFFVAATRNLQYAGSRAGVRRLVVTSIIGADRFGGGYGAAKVVHERAALEGPIPVHVLRAAQFHEFVEQLVQWGTQGDVVRVPVMRTQLVAARAAGEALAALATGPAFMAGAVTEIAGPREERFAEIAKLFIARHRLGLRVEEASDPADPMSQVFQNGGLLPGPYATLAGPTFEDWLSALSAQTQAA